MRALVCIHCGASRWEDNGIYRICIHCGTQYLKEDPDGFRSSRNQPQSVSARTNNTGISLEDDIEQLLKKCLIDRKNAKKYANLILDIDPDNEEVLKYL